MRKIIINKFFSLILLFGCLTSFDASGAIRHYLSVYDAPKYQDNFQNFKYVTPDAPKRGRVVLPAYGGFDSFNPFIFKGVAAHEATGLTLDTLGVSPADDPSTVYPLIAEKFDVPSNHSYVGFFINPKARFHDGSAINADDVIFSFNALIAKGSPLYRIYYRDVEKVQKISEKEVRFYFKKGTSNKELPLILAQLPVFSRNDWREKDFAKPTLKPMLGSGPYEISKFEAGKFVELKRDPSYWAKDLPTRKGFFNFDDLRYDYYQDTTITLQALFAGTIDLREEYIAKNWVTGYDNELIDSGDIIKAELQHNNTAILQNFAFNIRRPQFQDKRVRQAISLVFNFEWANEKLFYNQYRRLDSYFTNSDMTAQGKPQGKELKILNKYKEKLPPEVFGELPPTPQHTDYLATRNYLKQAVSLLQEAGYDFKNGKMVYLKTNRPLEIEVLSNTANGSAFTRVMLPFIKNLQKIGIHMTFRSVELNIFKNRLDHFDFDMAIVSFPMSQMPGNEQKEMWGSLAAKHNGSMNLIGVSNPVIDDLIETFIQTDKKEDYIATLKAFDRIMRHHYYLIPQWYAPYQRVAYHKKFAHPQTNLHVGFQPFTWWIKE